jgi:acetylornithine/succinyldiaminopimelate/putrescine aminotransferase
MRAYAAATRVLGGFEPEDIEIVRTRGPYLVDRGGKRYLDFMSGWNVGNFGWSAPHLRAAIHDYRGPDYVSPNFVYAPWVELAQWLVRLAPGALEVVYRATGGTEAVDIALQLAMAATGRGRFIAIAGDYHGNSVGAVSIAGEDAREPYPNLMRGCHSLAPPLDDRAADRLERMLRRRDVAAVVMEPIVTNLAVEIPTPGFMERLGTLCRRHGTLLVLDEVASGFGRTGKLFATEHYDVRPDILCLGKSISGGHAPLGAVLATRRVANKTKKGTSFYSTYGWHPLATAVALANVRWLATNRRRLLRDVAELSDYFRTRLAAMGFEELRIQGLAIAVRARSKRAAGRIEQACRERGLLIAAEDAMLTMFPPLTLDRRTAGRGLDILEACL